MSTSFFSLPSMVHSFQKYSGLPASDCVISMKDNIKTKFKQMTKWNALVFWHQRVKQMTAFSPWIQEWQRLEKIHSDQGSPGFQQLAEQGTHLSPCSAPGKRFPLFCRVFGMKLSHRYSCGENRADNLGKHTFAFLPIYDRHPSFLCRCGRCLKTLQEGQWPSIKF